MKKEKLIKYLNNYLDIDNFTDKSKNGLQVDSSKKEIKKIWYAVDATSYIFDKAETEKVDLVLVHHWLFWWFEEALVWLPYQRIKKLIKDNIALYASHLPLDAHKEVWNNIWLLKAFIKIFWLQKNDYKIEDFCEYNGNYIWFGIKFKKEIHISNIITPYAEQMQLIKKLYNFWNKEFIKSVCFVSWWAWSEYKQAFKQWYDLYITWEANHSDLVWAKELWQSILLWWHRETEKIWPKLLAYHLRDKFDLEIVFLDEKY